MGSLPDLTERSRPHSVRTAGRTRSDPHRNRAVINQIPVSTIYKKEWPWKKTKTPIRNTNARRRDSAASSVGAASVRRLIARQPPQLPGPLVKRYTLLCIASGLCYTALIPFTAFAGAEAGALPLAILHTVAAVVSPFSTIILQKVGIRLTVTTAHVVISLLLAAHIIDIPLMILLPLYAICGLTYSPMTLALFVSATTVSQAAGDEPRRKVVLRRALRGLHAAQDIGIVLGSLLLGASLLIWQEDVAPAFQSSNLQGNSSEDFYVEDDYEEKTCGSEGCPGVQSLPVSTLSAQGRQILVAVWATLAFFAACIAVFGTVAGQSPQPDARTIAKDPRTILGIPMGLFIGFQQGFILTSYIKWYGVCVGGWGGGWRALFGTGALQTLAAATLSMAAARGRRGALAAGGAAAHASLLLALLRWRAARTDLALPAVAAAAWGACAALWEVLQIGVCVGGGGWRGPWSIIIGSRHAGLALACVARAFLCVRSQLAILALSLLSALISFAVLHWRTRAESRHRT
ncbi:protein unc-93 homolog A [Aricia agestis]|uniref:protein unc-93 homolog A n=1 Tax=Aricia agestis TaxID=91739 RepID=UPI001C208A16|nr:protein unc-93 homolog A [Aricia agestis]